MRNLGFVFWLECTLAPTVVLTQQRGETMELLQLEPPDYGVHTTGIYIIGDDGTHVFAGPFDSESSAIGWIDQRQDALNRRRSARESAVH